MRQGSGLWAFTAVLALAACGASPSSVAERPTESAGDEPRVSEAAEGGFLRVEVAQIQNDGSVRRLRTGATLRSGERFYALVESHEPIYLYVVYVDPNDAATLLIPSGDRELRIQPDERRRVPETGESMQLDDVTGEETLYFVGSREPLTNIGDDTARFLEQVRRAGRASREDPASSGKQGSPSCAAPGDDGVVILTEAAGGCRDRRGIRLRGVVVVQDDDAVAAEAADDAGVAVVPFVIRHVP